MYTLWIRRYLVRNYGVDHFDLPVGEYPMIFELWEHRKQSNGGVLVSNAFARRHATSVDSKYHNMKLGESRTLSDSATSEICIIRTE